MLYGGSRTRRSTNSDGRYSATSKISPATSRLSRSAGATAASTRMTSRDSRTISSSVHESVLFLGARFRMTRAVHCNLLRQFRYGAGVENHRHLCRSRHEEWCAVPARSRGGPSVPAIADDPNRAADGNPCSYLRQLHTAPPRRPPPGPANVRDRTAHHLRLPNRLLARRRRSD